MKVKIIKPHTHRGEDLEVGQTYDLPEKAARFAIAAKSAEESNAKAAKSYDQKTDPANKADS